MSRLLRTQDDCAETLSSDQLLRALADLKDAKLKRSLRQAPGDYQNKRRDFLDVLDKVRELKEFLEARNR